MNAIKYEDMIWTMAEKRIRGQKIVDIDAILHERNNEIEALKWRLPATGDRITELEQGLLELYGQIDQARQVGAYQNSASMKKAMDEAKKLLGDKLSAEMKSEQQVCNMKLAKRLRELGVPQESWWSWWDKLVGGSPRLVFKGQIVTRDGATVAAAFTVAELGMRLPHKKYDDKMWKQIWEWEENGFSEADARAKMLIYLIEKGTVKP
ncbi:hypothetical protein IID24_03345 [Patescibacteria group bacterium]|nr:hypothetical protein [Patescibacteria group bacterium]